MQIVSLSMLCSSFLGIKILAPGDKGCMSEEQAVESVKLTELGKLFKHGRHKRPCYGCMSNISALGERAQDNACRLSREHQLYNFLCHHSYPNGLL